MEGFSGIVSFEITGARGSPLPFWRSLHIFIIPENLGGVELPAAMIHASIPKPEIKKAGLDDGLIRFVSGN